MNTEHIHTIQLSFSTKEMMICLASIGYRVQMKTRMFYEPDAFSSQDRLNELEVAIVYDKTTKNEIMCVDESDYNLKNKILFNTFHEEYKKLMMHQFLCKRKCNCTGNM